MAARKKKHLEEEHENHERWLVTYADMITLLMVLFIVLFSMATIDAKKFDALKDSLAGVKTPAASVLEGSQSVITGGQIQRLDSTAPATSAQFDLPSATNQAAGQSALQKQNQLDKARQQEQDNLEQVKQEIQSSLDARGMGDLVRFRKEPSGLVVTIVTDRVLFDSGKAEVRSEGKVILDALVPPLSHLPNPVTIEGHTDNVPISGGQFPSNWELSTGRSVAVLRYMVEEKGLPASKIAASGYADQKPVVPNDTAEHRSQNRRVEVIVHTIVGTDLDTTSSAVVAPVDMSPITTKETTEETSPSTSDLHDELPTLPEKPTITLPAITHEEH